LAESGDGSPLGAAHIRHISLRRKQRRNGLVDGRQRGNRCGNQHQIGMADTFGVDFRKRFINHPTLKRTVEIVAVEINAGHGLHPSQSFEVQNERAAYQSDADKGDVLERGV